MCLPSSQQLMYTTHTNSNLYTHKFVAPFLTIFLLYNEKLDTTWMSINRMSNTIMAGYIMVFSLKGIYSP